MKESLISYENVFLRPNYSELSSRSDADTSVNLLGWKFKLPIVPSNMRDTISIDNARYLSENNYFYIMHRFGLVDSFTQKFLDIADNEKWKLVSISTGVNENTLRDLQHIINNNYRVDFITIDVAHGHHKKVENRIRWIKHNLPSAKIIAGNVATSEGYKFLKDSGADIIKCGIGSGRICTTARQTGFHMPTLSSIYDIKKWHTGIPIIADGGCRYYGDIAKALVFGAQLVMSGIWFASCIDSPAKLTQDGKKIYRGSTSYEIKGEKNHIEGISLELEGGITYAERLEEIRQAICSGISYAGGKDLSVFNNVEWHLVL